MSETHPKPPLKERLERWTREFGQTGPGERRLEVTGLSFPIANVTHAKRTYPLDYEEAGVVVAALKAYANAMAHTTAGKMTDRPLNFAKAAFAAIVETRIREKFEADSDPQDRAPYFVHITQGHSFQVGDDALGVELAEFMRYMRSEGYGFVLNDDAIIKRYLQKRRENLNDEGDARW